MCITHPTSVVQSTELPSLSTDRHLVNPLEASFAPSQEGRKIKLKSVTIRVIRGAKNRKQ